MDGSPARGVRRVWPRSDIGAESPVSTRRPIPGAPVQGRLEAPGGGGEGVQGWPHWKVSSGEQQAAGNMLSHMWSQAL